MSLASTLRRIFDGDIPNMDDYRLLYPAGVNAGNVMAGFPVDFTGDREQTAAHLCAEGALQYDGLTFGPQGAQDYFEVTYSKPVMFYDEKTNQALFVFLFPGHHFFSAMATLDQAAGMIRQDIVHNLGYLNIFHMDPANSCQGTTYELAREKRRLIEAYTAVFERKTGVDIGDPLRQKLRDILRIEEKSIDMAMAKNAIYTLIEEAKDSVCDYPADIRKAEDISADLARKNMMDRVNNWLARN